MSMPRARQSPCVLPILAIALHLFAVPVHAQSQADMMRMLERMMQQPGGGIPGVPPGFRMQGRSETAEVQALLNQAGFNAGAVDGVAGPGTIAAIAAFQQSINHPPTGVLTPQELATLRSRAGPRQATGPATSAVDLADLQRRLNERGLDAGVVDGVWGQRSQRALDDYRRSIGVSRTGPPTPEDVAALAENGAKPLPPVRTAGGGVGITTRGPGGQSLSALPASDGGASLNVVWTGPPDEHFWLAVVAAGAMPVPGIPAWPRGATSPTRITVPAAPGAYEIAVIDIRDGSVPLRRPLEVH